MDELSYTELAYRNPRAKWPGRDAYGSLVSTAIKCSAVPTDISESFTRPFVQGEAIVGIRYWNDYKSYTSKVPIIVHGYRRALPGVA
jgi:hypothetical protein